MGVTHVRQITLPEFTITDDGVFTFETIFQVRFNDLFPEWHQFLHAKDPDTNLEVPKIGDQFPSPDALATFGPIEPYVTNVAWSAPLPNDSPNVFHATVTSRHDLYTADQPKNRKTAFRWYSEFMQVPAETGKDADDESDPRRITNNAGDPYDPPPLKFDNIDVCAFTVNVHVSENQGIADWAHTHRKKLNSAEITLDFRTIKRGNAMVDSITIDPRQRWGDFIFCPVHIVIRVAKPKATNPDATNLMQPEYQEQGYQQKVYVDQFGEPIIWPSDIPNEIQVAPEMQWKERICLADGVYPSSPQLLDIFGRHLRGPRTASDDEWQEYALNAKTRWYIHEYCDFSDFLTLTRP